MVFLNISGEDWQLAAIPKTQEKDFQPKSQKKKVKTNSYLIKLTKIFILFS